MKDNNILGIFIQIFLGIVIVVVQVIFSITIMFTSNSSIILVGIIIIMLVGTVIGSIKLLKSKEYKPMGITILSIAVPWLSILLLFGSCIGMLSS